MGGHTSLTELHSVVFDWIKCNKSNGLTICQRKQFVQIDRLLSVKLVESYNWFAITVKTINICDCFVYDTYDNGAVITCSLNIERNAALMTVVGFVTKKSQQQSYTSQKNNIYWCCQCNTCYFWHSKFSKYLLH